jgi:hypothetical protein
VKATIIIKSQPMVLGEITLQLALSNPSIQYNINRR